MKKGAKRYNKDEPVPELPVQQCPVCGKPISAFPGTRDALCTNCGYKDPCCD